MSIKLLGLAGFVFLLICAAPQRRIRRATLTISWAIGQVALLATIAAGGLFHLMPEKAPEVVAARMVAADVWIHSQFGFETGGMSWLAATAVLTLIGLPLLSLLDFAARLAAPTVAGPPRRKKARSRRPDVGKQTTAASSPGNTTLRNGSAEVADPSPHQRRTVLECLR